MTMTPIQKQAFVDAVKHGLRTYMTESVNHYGIIDKQQDASYQDASKKLLALYNQKDKDPEKQFELAAAFYQAIISTTSDNEVSRKSTMMKIVTKAFPKGALEEINDEIAEAAAKQSQNASSRNSDTRIPSPGNNSSSMFGQRELIEKIAQQSQSASKRSLMDRLARSMNIG